MYFSPWKKRLIILVGFCENLIFTGNILGWSALSYMLKENGIYGHLCPQLLESNSMSNTLSPPLPLPSQSTLFHSSSSQPSTSSSLSPSSILLDQGSSSETLQDLYVSSSLLFPTTNGTTTSKVHYLSSEEDLTDKSLTRRRTTTTTTTTRMTIKSAKDNQMSSEEEVKQEWKTCIEQDKTLNLAYTIGTFFNGFTAFVWGFLLDKWGLRVVRLIINAFLTVGSLLLCMVDKDRSYLIFPGITLLSLGGIPLRIANMQLANLYPKRRSSIIALYSGAFSASAITFVILKALHEQGLSFFWTCSVLVVASLMVTLSTFFLLPKDASQEESSPSLSTSLNQDSKPKLSFSKGNKFGHSRRSLESIETVSSNVKLEKFAYLNYSFRSPLGSNDPKSVTIHNEKNAINIGTLDIENKGIPLRASLMSFSFMIHQWWYAWLITNLIMYIGSMNLWLHRITDDKKKAGSFVELYGGLQVLSIVIAPIAGYIMDKELEKADLDKDQESKQLRKYSCAFRPMLFTTFCLALMLAARFFDHAFAVITSIVAITIFRSFLVAVGSAHLRTRFPAEHFNRLLGILSTTGACVTLIQYPLFVWEAGSPTGALGVNLFNCLGTLVAFINPIHLVIKPFQKYLIRKENKLN